MEKVRQRNIKLLIRRLKIIDRAVPVKTQGKVYSRRDL